MQEEDIDLKIVYLCVRGDRGEKAISKEWRKGIWHADGWWV